MKLNKKSILAGVILFITVVLNICAQYHTLNISEDEVSFKKLNLKTVAMYKNDGNGDTPISIMPESGYEINTEKSYCTTDNINKVYDKMYTDENGQHIITGLSKDDKCYLYFNKINRLNGSADLITSLTVKDSADSFTGVETGNAGVFKAQDDDGDTYYWRGAVTNNYVKFGKNKDNQDMYWRIIRINGDGTIRMIYDGTTSRRNGSKLTVERSSFNPSSFKNMYVGFKYTDGDVHGIGTDSKILGALNTWYSNNLDKESIRDKIDPNAGFCNDRDPYTDEKGTTPGGGTSVTTTYYGAYIRLISNYSTNAIPTFKCKNGSDLFTKSGATKKDGTVNGNRALTNPIGLITADEVVYAGGYPEKSNSDYYLYTGQIYWTLSPYNSFADVSMFYVLPSGSLSNNRVTAECGVRPVINLKADTKFTYNSETTKGSMNDPYVVS